jgi:hypothetical protein
MSNATELLRRALDCLLYANGADPISVSKEIRAFLAAEPEAEPEPVAWARKWYLDGEIPQKEKNERGRMAWPYKFKFLPVSCHKCCEDDISLYTKPEPSRKPMTEEEIKEICPFSREPMKIGFNSGVRFAEKHHGIGD